MCTLRIQASGAFYLLAGPANQRNNTVETSTFAIYSSQFFSNGYHSLHRTTDAQRTLGWGAETDTICNFHFILKTVLWKC